MTDENPNISPDLNNDGKIDADELKLHADREQYQRRMAYIAICGIIGVCLYIIGIADIEKIRSIGELLDMYFITLGGIVATAMGVSAWSTKKK